MSRNQDNNDDALILAASKLFYRENHTKEDIAESLKIDRRKVADLLLEARQKGLVRIYIEDEQIGTGLEQQLCEKHQHLQKVIIVPGGKIETESQYGDLLKRFGAEAARYLQNLVDHHDGEIHLGVSGGETLLEFASAVTNQVRSNLHVYATAFVGRGPAALRTSHVDPLVNATILWARSGRLPGHCHYASVPPYDIPRRSDLQNARPFVAGELDKLAARAPVRAAIEQMDQIDVVFAGIGMIKPQENSASLVNRLTMTALLRPLSLAVDDELVREGAAGELSYCLFSTDGEQYPKDPDGNRMRKEDWRFFLSAGHYSRHSGLDFYRHMVEERKKVVITGGPYKLPAIRAALKSKAFNVLITDEHSASELAQDS